MESRCCREPFLGMRATSCSTSWRRAFASSCKRFFSGSVVSSLIVGRSPSTGGVGGGGAGSTRTGCRDGAVRVTGLGGAGGAGGGSVGGIVVASASGLTGWGAGKYTFVCGIESGCGGGAGGAGATGFGAGGAGLAACGLRRTQPPSETAIAMIRTASARRMEMPPSNRNRQADKEGRALAWFAGEVDCTIVELHDPERHREPDPRAFFACREIQAEDFFA